MAAAMEEAGFPTKPTSSYPDSFPSNANSVPTSIELSDRSSGKGKGAENVAPAEGFGAQATYVSKPGAVSTK